MKREIGEPVDAQAHAAGTRGSDFDGPVGNDASALATSGLGTGGGRPDCTIAEGQGVYGCTPTQSAAYLDEQGYTAYLGTSISPTSSASPDSSPYPNGLWGSQCFTKDNGTTELVICIAVSNTNGDWRAITTYNGYSLPAVTPLGISNAGLGGEWLYLNNSPYATESIGVIDRYPEGGRTQCHFSTPAYHNSGRGFVLQSEVSSPVAEMVNGVTVNFAETNYFSIDEQFS